MLELSGDGRYADVVERALCNAALGGVSLDGREFFYDNPLAGEGGHHRRPWFECACCPPNLARLLASLRRYVYGWNGTDVAMDLSAAGTARFRAGGREATLRRETRYPWDGSVTMDFDKERPATFGLRLRFPGWCRKAVRNVNDAPSLTAEAAEDGCVRAERAGTPEERVRLEMEMPVERIRAHSDVRQNAGRVALRRGPVVYCLEGADRDVPLQRIFLPEGASLEIGSGTGVLDGAAVITGEARAADPSGWDGIL